MASGWVRSAISPNPAEGVLWLVVASAAMVGLIRRTLLIGLEEEEVEICILVANQQGRGLRFSPREAHRAGEFRLRLALNVRWAIHRGDLVARRFFNAGFDLVLGLAQVDDRLAAAHRKEHGDRESDRH